MQYIDRTTEFIGQFFYCIIQTFKRIMKKNYVLEIPKHLKCDH